MNLLTIDFPSMEKDICTSAATLIAEGEIEVFNYFDFVSIIVPKIAKEFTEEFSPIDIEQNYAGLLHDFSKDCLLAYYKESKLP